VAIGDATFWTAVGAVATWVAAAGALLYAERQSRLLQLEHTPLLRMAPMFQNGALYPHGVFLKNVGRGPAIGVFLVDRGGVILDFNASGSPCPSIDAIDPPSGGQPDERLGRLKVQFQQPLTLQTGTEFILWYQDVEGDWHRTREEWLGTSFRAEFLGRAHAVQVPDAVARQAHVKRASHRAF
jgi:hypothetical protein